MKEHPIIFSTDMVKAILNGSKTQTRRVVQPEWKKLIHDWDNAFVTSESYKLHVPVRHPEEPDFSDRRITRIYCSYGQAGDRLWVRETHYRWGRWVKNGFTKTGKQKWTLNSHNNEILYIGDTPRFLPKGRTGEVGWFKRPSIHMPRWASRITLEITEVRVERVQEITEADTLAEGLIYHAGFSQWYISPDTLVFGHKTAFANLWDSLNAKRGYGWGSNPWVWVISFKSLE